MRSTSLLQVPCALLALSLPVTLAAQSRAPVCAADNAGLTLPAGFCALVVVDSIGPARHLVALPNGDLLVAVRGNGGGVRLLRDTTGDGHADVVRGFGPAGGTGIAYRDGFLYFATDDAVVRWAWRPGQLEPAGAPDTIVRDLTNRRQHAAKGIALGADGALYVNIGAPANACQVEDRAAGSPGQDPCQLLEIAGGIWRFDATRSGQRQTDGRRHATGLRNALSLAVQPGTGTLFAAQHGRDDLHRIWPALFTEAQSAEKPAEEVFQIEGGTDYGWP
jgi:glucose/arabinose dehydrogenase